MSTTLANLEIAFACSWQFGGVTQSANVDYINHINGEEHGQVKDNLWTPRLAGLPGPGAIFWKVSYPTSPGYPSGDFPFTSIQTTLLNDMQDNSLNTTINYSPPNLKGSPFTPVAGTDLVVCAAYWGSENRTQQVQAFLSTSIKQGHTALNFRMSSFGAGPNNSARVCVVYAYVKKFDSGGTDVKFFGYSGPETDYISLSLTRPPQLTILGALFGLLDVTATLQYLVSGQQTLNLDLSKLTRRFNPTPEQKTNVTTLSILYQYEGQDIKCLTGNEGSGQLLIMPVGGNPAAQNMVRTPRAGEPNIRALVWGDGTKIDNTKPAWPWAEVKNDSITTGLAFKPSQAYFGGSLNDPMPGQLKSTHVYYSYGITGVIQSAAAFEEKPIKLLERDLGLSDPKPAKGLLAPDGSSPCFRLQSYSSQKWLGLDAGPGTLRSIDLKDRAAVFRFVPLATEGGNTVRMLKAVDPGTLGSWLYLSPQSGFGQWSTTVTSRATFKQAPAIGTLDAGAFNFNYEVPSTISEEGIVLCVCKTIPANGSGYSIGAQAFYEDQNGVIQLVPYSQAVVATTRHVFVPEFVPDPKLPKPVKRGLLDINIDPCTVSTFKLIYTLGYGAIIFILPWGPVAESTMVQRVFQWWEKISSALKGKVASFLTRVQDFFRRFSSGASTGSSGFVELIKKAFEFTKILWETKGALWTLFKALFFESEGYWWIFKLTLQIAVASVKWLSPASATAITVLQYTLWCFDLQSVGTSVIRSCVVTLQKTPMARARAMVLEKSLASIGSAPETKTLSDADQFDMIHALTSPVAERLFEGSEDSAPAVHPLVDFHDALHSASGLEQRHIENAHSDLYRALSPKALQVARTFAPDIQKSLLMKID